MAKAATDEQLQLRRRARRRLIGAIALVTVIAVVLPWVLEHEPRSNEADVAVVIPSRDTPFAAPAPHQPAADQPVPAPVPSPTQEGAASEGRQDDPSPAAAADPPTARERPSPPAGEAKKKPADKAEAGDQKLFVVQITALADADKAAGIQHDLAAKGLKSYTEKVKTASGEVTRVRVGPFQSREAAEKERARLKSLGFDGNVTPR
jgi:DedD protein